MLKVIIVMSSFKIPHNIQLENLRKTATDLTVSSSHHSVKICIEKKWDQCNVCIIDTQSVVMISNGQSFYQLHECLKYMSV